ncbi:MAG: hypothetical protein AB7U20_05055 [Planctomycetaceae bacterium]
MVSIEEWLATYGNSLNGLLYDLDDDGDANDSLETLFRTLANDVYSAINEQGDI